MSAVENALARREAILAELADIDLFLRLAKRFATDKEQPETADEKVGGFPVAAAPYHAEETGGEGPIPSLQSDAGYAKGRHSGDAEDAGVTAGETAQGETGMVLGTGRERPLPVDFHIDSDPEARFDSASLHQNNEATGKPPVEKSPGAPAPKSKKQMVLECHEAHPEWSVRKIAEKLNLTKGAVSGHLHFLGIKLSEVHARLAQEAEDAQSTDPAPDAPEPEKSAPVTPPAASRPSERLSEHKAQYGSPLIPGPVKRPKGTQFRLRERANGQYLHMTCQAMTRERAYAWVGNERQLLACRQKFPLATDLVEEVVEQEDDQRTGRG